jgi:DNA-binding HxlR family transcriptional regulator
MLYRDYPEQNCSIARTLEVVGERWSMLIIRDVFSGIRRYEDLHRSLSIARNILQTRLNRLVEERVLERRPYAGKTRYEYYLTKKGRDLWPALMTMLDWGDRYYGERGAPRIFRHKGCGGRMDGRLNCRKCGESLTPKTIYMEWGPGADAKMREARDALEASEMLTA